MTTKTMWRYSTDAVTSSYSYRTPQDALDAAVKAGDWWRGAEKDGGEMRITPNDGRGFLDADSLAEMLKAVR